MQKFWVWLATLEGITLRQKHKLLDAFSTPEEIYNLSDKEICGRLSKEPTDFSRDLTAAEKILRACKLKGVDILPIGHKQYPPRLKEIGDPPVILYYKGILPDFEASPMLAMVGTRKATTYGKNSAEQLAGEITACGGTVVSGGAAGIDAHALQGALDAGGAPIAVLGCGVDIAYPPTNRRLFSQIVQKGCLISEYAPGTRPKPWQFPARNRIISGISNGVVVIEAPEKSGALITAKLALDYGRDVYVVPGNIDVLTCMGSNRLLQDGAGPVIEGWDAVSPYQNSYPNVAQNKKNIPEKKIPDKTVIDNLPSKPYHSLNDGACALTPEECQLLNCLSREPKSVDEVVAQVDIPPTKALSILTNLALRGIVINHSGRRVSVK